MYQRTVVPILDAKKQLQIALKLGSIISVVGKSTMEIMEPF